jgi:hypothetical protein
MSDHIKAALILALPLLMIGHGTRRRGRASQDYQRRNDRTLSSQCTT